MRSPSARVLIDRCDIYPANQVQDVDGGVQFTYTGPAAIRDEPCSAQPVETVELLTEQERLIRETTWKILFGRPTGVKNRDHILVTDPAGVVHTCVARIEQDQAGRGGAYVVHAVERV